MARKDNKGRNLKTGEYQRPDGRYEYRYKDEITGKRNSVYAADLASLREMEKKINKDMEDLLITDASVKKLTVNTLFERYMATKNIKERTKKNYIRMWDYRIRNTLGNIRVVDFKTSHVRTFFSALSDEGLAHSTIKGLYGLLNPSFELAVEDGIIRKNPVTGTLGDYGAPAKEKEALTLEQQEKLLKFVEQSNVYKPHLPMMQVMFGACLRVSETIGLTWSDVDMKNREIHVGGQLVYYEGDEGYCFHDSETKTDAGIRDIPMTQMVYDAFRKQREMNLMLGLQSNVEIGGRSGFIFNTKHGRPIMPAGVNSFLKNIVNAYNKKESKLAEEEKREPELMPPISSHTLRHTGCTRLGENNVNPKVMQYVMGHSDAQITINEYKDYNLVLATTFGMPIGASHVRTKMKQIIKKEGLPDVVFHSLRHTSVTYKLKLSGGDIKAVQGDSGHAQADMVTEVYGHILDEDRKKNAQLMENAFYNKENLNPDIHGASGIQNNNNNNMISVPEGVDADMLMKVLGNPEMAALLTSLAKSIKG